MLNQMGTPYSPDWVIRRRLGGWLPPTPPTRFWEFVLRWPLVLPACAFMGGIIVAEFKDIPLILSALLVSFAAALFGVGWQVRRFCLRYGAMVCWIALLVAVGALGALRHRVAQVPLPSDVRCRLQSSHRFATLIGDVISDVVVENPDRWAFGKYFPGKRASHFYLKLSGAQTEKGIEPLSGVVRVQVGEAISHIRRGQRVQVYAVLNPFRPPSNPGQFDLQRYMMRRKVGLAVFAPIADSVQRLGTAPAAWLGRWQDALRRWAYESLVEQADLPDDTQSLATALLLGWRGDLDGATYRAFVQTGLAHFISLSGMHIGILAGTLWLASRYLGVDKRWRAALCLALIALYGLIIPPRPPALRAILLAFFYFGGVILRRRTEPFNTLALCALVLLMVRPDDLFTPSFQLSFACTAGIVLFWRPVYETLALRLVAPWVDRLPQGALNRPGAQAALALFDAVLYALAVGFAAWLGGAGVLAYHFYAITPLSAVFTVVALPLVTAMLYAGYAKCLLTALFPTAAVICAAILDGAGRLFVSLVRWFADWPAAYLPTGAVPLMWVVVGYAIVLLWRMASNPTVKKAVMIVGLVLLATAGTVQLSQRRGLTMTVADVGHGQAVWLRFDDGTNWLIDAGSITVKNVGAKIITPMLRYYGVSRVDAALITHGDMDHLNGLPEIAEALPIRSLAAAAPVLAKSQERSSVSYLLDLMRRRGLTVHTIAELPLPKSAKVEWLWPTADALEQPYSDNDLSLVCRVSYAGRSILLCGDIEIAAQKQLQLRYPHLRADVVVLPHHGSKNTLDEAFVDFLQPRLVIASCANRSAGNTLLSPQTEPRPPFDTQKMSFSTADDGAVEIKIKADGTINAAAYSRATRFIGL